jgi:hypothetical protein
MVVLPLGNWLRVETVAVRQKAGELNHAIQSQTGNNTQAAEPGHI